MSEFCIFIVTNVRYADKHDADENERTSPAHGGRWTGDDGVGIHLRHIVNTPDKSGDTVVASKKIMHNPLVY